jgi:hypothetical protein
MKHCAHCSAPTRAQSFRGYVFCRRCRSDVRATYDGFRRTSLKIYLGIVEPRDAERTRVLDRAG